MDARLDTRWLCEMSVSRSGSILANMSALVLVLAKTQLVLVSLVDDDDDEDEDEDDEHPVLLMHRVWRLSLPSSYGNDVVAVVPDLSGAPDSARFDRVAFTTQTRTPTTSMTETAPMNEPSKVCFSSDEVRANVIIEGWWECAAEVVETGDLINSKS